MHPKCIVQSFVEALGTSQFTKSAIAIKLSYNSSLDLPDAETIVEGFDWPDSVEQDRRYDLVVVDLPLGMGRKKIEHSHWSTSAQW